MLRPVELSPQHYAVNDEDQDDDSNSRPSSMDMTSQSAPAQRIIRRRGNVAVSNPMIAEVLVSMPRAQRSQSRGRDEGAEGQASAQVAITEMEQARQGLEHEARQSRKRRQHAEGQLVQKRKQAKQRENHLLVREKRVAQKAEKVKETKEDNKRQAKTIAGLARELTTSEEALEAKGKEAQKLEADLAKEKEAAKIMEENLNLHFNEMRAEAEASKKAAVEKIQAECEQEFNETIAQLNKLLEKDKKELKRKKESQVRQLGRLHSSEKSHQAVGQSAQHEEELHKIRQAHQAEVKKLQAEWQTKYDAVQLQFQNVEKKHTATNASKQKELDSLAQEKEQYQQHDAAKAAKIAQLSEKNKRLTKQYIKEGRMLPDFDEKSGLSTSGTDKVNEDRLRRQAVKLLPFLSQLSKHLPILDKALEIVSTAKSDGRKAKNKNVQDQIDQLQQANFVGALHQLSSMKVLTVKKCEEVVKQVNMQMNDDCEADIKVVTQVADERLDYSRDRRFRDVNQDGKTSLKKLTIYEGHVIDSVQCATKYKRVKKLKERAKKFGLKVNENGTVVTRSVMKAASQCHEYAIANNNSLVSNLDPQNNGREFFLFSGDGLGTGRGESSTICAMRSAELKIGSTSSYNFEPVSSCLGSDHWPELNETFKAQVPEVNNAILNDGWIPKGDFGITGDLAFLLSVLGLSTAGSTFGNPWVAAVDDKGARVDVNSDGDPNWRDKSELYLYSHEKPPGHDWARDGEIVCPCGRNCFVANCDADVAKDKEKCDKMSTHQRRNYVKKHHGNCPHQAPIFVADPKNVFPGLYHLSENMVDHLWKNGVWVHADTNEKKYDVNAILLKEVGYCHLPPTRGDDVYCMSFIGKDINNFRAQTTIIRLLNVMFPECMAQLQGLVDPAPATSPEEIPVEPQPATMSDFGLEGLAEFEGMMDDDDGQPPVVQSVEDAIQQNLDTAEHAAMGMLSKPELLSHAFDCIFKFLDEVMDENYDDTTEQGRTAQANKLASLAKDAVDAKERCFSKALFSEYDVVAKVIVPAMVKMHGKRLIRANEQGQEQLGQRFKRAIKFCGNKKRTFGWYLRKLKKARMVNGVEVKEVRVDSKATVFTTSLTNVCLQNEIAQSSNHRYHNNVKGLRQEKLKQAGEQLKRDHCEISSKLKDPAWNKVEESKHKSRPLERPRPA